MKGGDHSDADSILSEAFSDKNAEVDNHNSEFFEFIRTVLLITKW
jgi:hypothetical protein